MLNKVKEKHFFYILMGAATLVCALIFWPFFSVILVSMALTVALHPVFVWIRKNLAFGRSTVAAMMTILLFVACLGVPLYFIGSWVFAEAQSLYNSLASGGINLRNLPIPEVAGINLQSKVVDILSFVSLNLLKIFTSTLSTFASILLVILSMFYFFSDGERWKKYIVRLSPLSDAHDERILTMLARAINGVVRGYVIIGITQGVLMSIGLRLFGVPNAALWGVLAAIVSMIPTIGTALISIPAIIYLYLSGNHAAAGGMLIWAVVVVGTVDNFLNPIIVGKNLDLSPIIILFAVLGGIALMGPVGILIGPLAVSLFYTLALIYQEDFQS